MSLLEATIFPTGQVSVKVAAEDPKTLFRLVAEVQEIFSAESSCGVCGSKDLRFGVRTVVPKIGKNAGKTFQYHEIRCANPSCHARFEFGVLGEGKGLFPRRRDDDGAWLPNRGWSKYQPRENEQ